MQLTVVGLDGASRNVFGRWLDDLPNIRTTIENGYSGTLHSTDPPITNVAWTSFITGKGPGQTEVFDWVYLDEHYEPQQYRGHEVRHEALYDLVPGSTYINLPAAYPRLPMQDDASIVYAFDAPNESVAVPEEFKRFEEYDSYVSGKTDDDDTDIEQLRELREIARKRFEFSKRVFEETENLFYVLFSATDFGLHIVPEFTDEYEDLYRALYEDIDEYVGWFRERSENLVLVSDHGFQENTRRFNVLDWLASNGYLAQPESDSAASITSLTDCLLANRYVYSVAQTVHRFLTGVVGIDATEEAYDSLTETAIDYERTRAFKSGGLWNLVINRSDVFDEGCVDPEEVPALRSELVSKLDGVADPETGDEVFEYVRAAPEVYGTDHPHSSDVVFNPADGFSIGGFAPSGRPFDDTQVFNHRKRGFYALDGPSFTDGTGDADIIDIMPTLLHVLGRAVPDDLDGTVITNALAMSSDIEYGPPSVLDSSPPAIERSEKDDEILHDRLEDLGYI